MMEKFEALLEKKDKTLHDKMLIAAIRVIVYGRRLNDINCTPNDIYCEIEKQIEIAEQMEGKSNG